MKKILFFLTVLVNFICMAQWNNPAGKGSISAISSLKSLNIMLYELIEDIKKQPNYRYAEYATLDRARYEVDKFINALQSDPKFYEANYRAMQDTLDKISGEINHMTGFSGAAIQKIYQIMIELMKVLEEGVKSLKEIMRAQKIFFEIDEARRNL